jgi:hypothetical protein
MAKRRVYRKAKPKPPKGYDSVFEHTLHTGILKSWIFHPDKVSYHVPHTYEPDFKKTVGENTVLLECKGRFRDRAEATKYIYIRESLYDHEELVFLFYDSYTAMPNAKRRMDGTKQTHREWAARNKFRYYCNKEGFDVKQLIQ